MTVTTNMALLIFHAAIGLTLAAHGAQKLFGWFGGPGPVGMSQILRKQGYKPVWFWVGLAIVGELGGGLSFALGFLTPLGAAGIFGAVVMAVVLQSDDLTGVVKGHAVAAQGVAEQIIERRSTDAH